MIKLHWNLAETLKDKKKTVKKLAKETSRCENTILKLKNEQDNTRLNINMQVLEEICNALDCYPTDLIKFNLTDNKATQNKESMINKNIEDSIFELTKDIIDDIINDAIFDIPPNKITTAMERIRNILKEKLLNIYYEKN